jgi:hypothetical protein
MEPLEEFDPLTDFDMACGDDVWLARPQLFFSCSLCPIGQTENKYSHREVSLVFFSTFEPITLLLAERHRSSACAVGRASGILTYTLYWYILSYTLLNWV